MAAMLDGAQHAKNDRVAVLYYMPDIMNDETVRVLPPDCGIRSIVPR